MTSWKMFFLNDPNWPQPPAGDPLLGGLALLGVGRIVLWAVVGKYLLESLWKFTG